MKLGDKTILENFRGTTQSDKWIDYCICVGDTAGRIAQALKEKGYDVDIERLIDIMIRRGAYSNTQYHIKETYKLKEYFDSLLGYNLYDLFPEIKNNL